MKFWYEKGEVIILVFALLIFLTLFISTSCIKQDTFEVVITDTITITNEVTINIDIESIYGIDTITHDSVVVKEKISLIRLTNITSNSASVEGVVEGSSSHSAFDYGVCWGESPLPTIYNYHCNPIQFQHSEQFTIFMGNLNGNTTYYVRPYLIKSNDVFYGEGSVSFKTL